jgi:hypothetical protein
VTVNDACGQTLFRYGLDLVPFASCDATDPRKIYFVTAPSDGRAMLHLFLTDSIKMGLEYTFTMAQAFHVRWNSIGAAATMPGRRCTSPTGMVGMSMRSPTSAPERRAKSPNATLGTRLLKLNQTTAAPASAERRKSKTRAELRADSDYLTIEGREDDDCDL